MYRTFLGHPVFFKELKELFIFYVHCDLDNIFDFLKKVFCPLIGFQFKMKFCLLLLALMSLYGSANCCAGLGANVVGEDRPNQMTIQFTL